MKEVNADGYRLLMEVSQNIRSMKHMVSSIRILRRIYVDKIDSWVYVLWDSSTINLGQTS